MALSQHDLLRLMESLRTADGIELIRVLAQRILQELIEAEATSHIGAEPGEHTEPRTTMRDGHREKVLTTQAGDLDLGGDTGICGDLDAELGVFRTRPLDHTRCPYIYLDATYCKARVNHRIVSQAVVIATGITEGVSLALCAGTACRPGCVETAVEAGSGAGAVGSGAGPAPQRPSAPVSSAGLEGEATVRYADEWIVGIEDLTGLAREVRGLVRAGELGRAAALLPEERPYAVAEDVVARLRR